MLHSSWSNMPVENAVVKRSLQQKTQVETETTCILRLIAKLNLIEESGKQF